MCRIPKMSTPTFSARSLLTRIAMSIALGASLAAAGDDPELPPGYTIIEGDIVVPESLLQVEAAYQTNLWTNEIVPYEFFSNVSQANQTQMLTAMQQWQNVTNVAFVQCANNHCAGNYLRIRDSTSNNSQVGMAGGRQDVNIFSWGSTFVMDHELGHALGYWHEHQRADRNQVIVVHQQNVDPTQCTGSCFTTNFGANAPNNYGPYDLDSVMHYKECAYATPPCPCGNPAACQTIEVLMTCNTLAGVCQSGARTGFPCQANVDCDPRGVGACNAASSSCAAGRIGQPCTDDASCDIIVGQRDHLSHFDGMTMSFLYPESNWRFVNGSYTGPVEAGTFLQPFRSLTSGEASTPGGGVLWVQPGIYSAVGMYAKPMTLEAPLGAVTLH